MNKRILLGLLLVAVGCSSKQGQENQPNQLPYYQEATFTPNWFESPDVVPTNFHRIPDFNLINQRAESITEQEVDGKILVVDFFFTTCPGICPTMTRNMTVVQEAFLNDEDVVLLSHSVTPEKDNVSVLQAYAEEKGVVDGKWHLLTGDRSEIYDLGRNQYFVEEDLGIEKNPEDFIHTENIILVDGNRHIRGIYNGLNKTAINQLIADIKTLKIKSEQS